MSLLDDASLARSSVVANSRMNRQRGARGVNSYEKELRLDPIRFLQERLAQTGSAAWLDLCCGRGRALIDAAAALSSEKAPGLVLHGVDLVDMFDEFPREAKVLTLETCPLLEWRPGQTFDLITCVHGLHYVGDKLAVIERAASWLSEEGVFLASLDLSNFRHRDGTALGRIVAGHLRRHGLTYDSRRHVLALRGARNFSLGFQFVGADDDAGANYSGQEAVDSYYLPSP